MSLGDDRHYAKIIKRMTLDCYSICLNWHCDDTAKERHCRKANLRHLRALQEANLLSGEANVRLLETIENLEGLL